MKRHLVPRVLKLLVQRTCSHHLDRQLKSARTSPDKSLVSDELNCLSLHNKLKQLFTWLSWILLIVNAFYPNKDKGTTKITNKTCFFWGAVLINIPYFQSYLSKVPPKISYFATFPVSGTQHNIWTHDHIQYLITKHRKLA